MGSGEYEQNCSFDFHKSMPMSSVKSIDLKISTNLKAETINSREIITELIKKEFEALRKEFAIQREELSQLLQTVKAQKTELDNIKNGFIEQKVHIKNIIKEEFEIQKQKFQVQNTNLSKNITEHFSNQTKVQEQLLEEAVKTATATLQIDSTRWNKNFQCLRNCGPISDLPDSCEEAMSSNFSQDGVYLLHLANNNLSPFFVYCKRIDKQVWTIMQRREDGSVDFYRNWADYKQGFGNLYGEFWLGLERLHAMTKAHKYELHIWLETQNGAEGFAHYKEFSIANETEKYKLTVGDYSGNAGDDLFAKEIKYRSSGMKFSTYDNCNDIQYKFFEECAKHYKGAWWFSKCYVSHLNGVYKSAGPDGVDWNDFGKKLKYAQMAIRRV